MVIRMSETGPRYQNLHPSELEYFERRDIREPAVEELKEAIEARGYDDGRPMKVVPNGQGYLVADGNHRLRAVEEKGLDREIPCLVYEGGDPVEIGLESNRGEDVYAQEDLFDTLDTIEYLQEEGLTQAEIADVLDDGFESWSESKVKNHSSLLNVVTEVLDMARRNQKGRVTGEVTNVTFNFTEGWFRNSGLYELDAEWNDEHAQLHFMEWFVNGRDCDTSKQQIERKVNELKRIQDQLEKFDVGVSEAVDKEKRESKREEIIRGELSDSQVEDAIEQLNQGAKDQYHFGSDSLDILNDIPDNEVDIVVTDPPYGFNYESHRETDNPDFGEGKDETLQILADVFEELERVCKANSHIYLFFPIDYMCDVKKLASDHFRVDETPLIWKKNRHTPMVGGKSFNEMHAHIYETIFILRMENGYSRKLNKDVSPNVLESPVPTGEDRWHDSQKPQGLLEDIITNCTGEGEIVLDPFAGSGSTLLAAASTDRHFIGIERDDSYESRFKRELGELDG